MVVTSKRVGRKWEEVDQRVQFTSRNLKQKISPRKVFHRVFTIENKIKKYCAVSSKLTEG